MYYLGLALRGFKRNPVLTALMVTAIAVGVGATMTMVSLLHGILSNPAGPRSGTLYHVQVDPRPAAAVAENRDPPDGLTYQDTLNLLHLHPTTPRTITSATWLPVEADVRDFGRRMVTMRAATADFFAMFDVPFQYGGPWSSVDDGNRAPLAVISKELNDRLFGGADSVGRTLIIATRPFRIVGVLRAWNPQPHFYDIDDGAFGPESELYLPFFTWLDLPQDYGYGSMSCWGRNVAAGEHNPKAPDCGWIQMWVELPTPDAVGSFRALLASYAHQQQATGRFQGPGSVRLLSVSDWLSHKRLLPGVILAQTWIAAGIFLVCMLNTVGLLFVKLLSQERDRGIRRALGASRRAILAQHLAEAAVVGLAGGLLGSLFTFWGVALVHQRAADMFKTAQFDTPMLLTTIAAAVVATLLAATWPAWHASFVTPGQQMRA